MRRASMATNPLNRNSTRRCHRRLGPASLRPRARRCLPPARGADACRTPATGKTARSTGAHGRRHRAGPFTGEPRSMAGTAIRRRGAITTCPMLVSAQSARRDRCRFNAAGGKRRGSVREGSGGYGVGTAGWRVDSVGVGQRRCRRLAAGRLCRGVDRAVRTSASAAPCADSATRRHCGQADRCARRANRIRLRGPRRGTPCSLAARACGPGSFVALVVGASAAEGWARCAGCETSRAAAAGSQIARDPTQGDPGDRPVRQARGQDPGRRSAESDSGVLSGAAQNHAGRAAAIVRSAGGQCTCPAAGGRSAAGPCDRGISRVHLGRSFESRKIFEGLDLEAC
jgi:hypothetical protein